MATRPEYVYHAVHEYMYRTCVPVLMSRVWLAEIFNFLEDHSRYISEEQAKHFREKIDTLLHESIMLTLLRALMPEAAPQTLKIHPEIILIRTNSIMPTSFWQSWPGSAMSDCGR